MQRDEMVTFIANTLGNRADKNDRIVDMLNFVIRANLEKDPVHPWFLLSERSTAVTTADEPRLPVPTDWIQDWEFGCLWRYDATADPIDKRLVKDDYNALKVRYTTPGEPSHFAMAGGYYVLFPIPDAVYTIKQKYYKQATLFVTGAAGDAPTATNVWSLNAADWLMGVAGMKMAMEMRDEKALQMFAGMKQSGREDVVRRSVEMEEIGTER